MSTPIKNCHRCPLRDGCEQVIPGVGSLESKLVLVGMTPGPEEDLEGKPFVGRWRRLLEIILAQAGIGDIPIYTTYLVKCMPGKKRVTSTHINTCKFWLWKELTQIKPRVVVSLGKIPAQTLLLQKSSFQLDDFIGKTHAVSYMSAVVAPWYSLDKILNEGAALREQTISFFSGLRNLLV